MKQTIQISIGRHTDSGWWFATSKDLPELFLANEDIDGIVQKLPDAITLIHKYRDIENKKNSKSPVRACDYQVGGLEIAMVA